ncbi:MAG: copper resistance system multicopper oxidase [Gammaproteobacteria bacterium]|nr:copper resistance system multicopper oxidase [Gammaproteobacteria bacterium]
MLPDLPRRRFIQGLAAGGVLLGMSPLLKPAWAQERATANTNTGTAPVLIGTEFDLIVEETAVNFTGTPRMATVVNGSLPAPTLRWREGDTVTLRVTNRLNEPTAIHWHGIILPYEMDGVPGISFHGIAPGETFTYRFKVQQTGTYWYHAHTLHEQTGLYGAIIIDPAHGDSIKSDRDYVVQLSDWTDEDPLAMFKKLKKRGDYYNFHQPTASDFFHDVSAMGLTAALNKRQMWNQMRMNPTDLTDISGYTYTYLMNGTTPAGNWSGLFKPGERIRLRFINAGTATFFDVRIPGLALTVILADGQNVEPVTVDEFRIGPGETYDVLVSAKDEAYTIFAQGMDRSGYARGTLAPRLGMTADVPVMDKPEWLTMTDMMGAVHDAQVPREPGMAGAADMGVMDHSAHGSMAMNNSTVRVRHASTEFGPSVDMRVDTPRTNLDDPGVGLRNNGRRVLTYADLHTMGGPLDQREPGREIELHLTGNMERYAWSIDGLEFGKSKPIHFRHGERLRVILHNDTMMTHPMHLHGMWSELENTQGKFLVRKHTFNVQPAQRISFLVTADAPGHWAWHCHLLYHMAAGMLRQVVVA